MRVQLARYRAAGEAAIIVERSPRRLAIRVSDATPDRTIEGLIAVERGCCPFFECSWEPRERELAMAVVHAEHEPALDAIAHALGIGAISG